MHCSHDQDDIVRTDATAILILGINGGSGTTAIVCCVKVGFDGKHNIEGGEGKTRKVFNFETLRITRFSSFSFFLMICSLILSFSLSIISISI